MLVVFNTVQGVNASNFARRSTAPAPFRIRHLTQQDAQFPLPAHCFLIVSSRVPKWLKLIVAVLLLPFAWGAAIALGRVLRYTGRAEAIWIAVLAGAGCWLAIFLLLPKPMRLYVFGHELTHALWTWLFGGRVKKFKAGAKGGYVVITKTNFLIALAPYFFPVYVALVLAVFAAGHWLWNWRQHFVFCHLLIGAAYAFHVTLTLHVLKTRQTDITSQGYFFSALVIFLGNVLVLLVGIPLLTAEVSVGTALRWWWQETIAGYSSLILSGSSPIERHQFR